MPRSGIGSRSRELRTDSPPAAAQRGRAERRSPARGPSTAVRPLLADGPSLYPQATMGRERYFICPHCANRSMATDRNAGFRREARGCEKCGFAYLFELLDDYYPAPAAAFFACDAEGRIVDCGRGSFELTGLRTEQVIGRPAVEVLGLRFDDGSNYIAQALEWEVRVRGKAVSVQAERDLPARAVADIFPAYDDDEGGVLLVLTPTNSTGADTAAGGH